MSRSRACSASRAQAAGAVRHGGRAAEPRRDVEPVDQPSVLRARLAVARVGAAGAHPGVDLRAARRRPDAEPQAVPHRDHHQRPQGYDRALSRRGAHRAFVPDLRGKQRRPPERQRAGRHGRDPLFRAAAGERGRLVLGQADPVAAVQAQRQRLAGRIPAARRRHRGACSTTATSCRSRSTRWSRASPSSTRIFG